MSPIIYLDKTQAIVQFLIFVIILPLVIGLVVGSITGKIRTHTIKLPLLITASLSLVFLIVILITLQNQSIPALALMLSVVNIIILNGSAMISHRLIGKALEKK